VADHFGPADMSPSIRSVPEAPAKSIVTAPKKAHPTDTSSRGSHDRVLTFFGMYDPPLIYLPSSRVTSGLATIGPEPEQDCRLVQSLHNIGCYAWTRRKLNDMLAAAADHRSNC
jgi:hypothetical protein